MTTPPDNQKEAHRADTIVSEPTPVRDGGYRSDEATAVTHRISEEGELLPASYDATPETLARQELYVDDVEASKPNTPARSDEAPTAIMDAPIGDDGDEDDDEGEGATDRHAAPAPEPTPTPTPPTAVGPLPDRSPGASMMDGEPAVRPVPNVQAWKVVPTGQHTTTPAQPEASPAPSKPQGLQTVLWTMKPIEDEDEDEESDTGPITDYRAAEGTVARAAQTYIVEAMDMLDGMKEHAGALDSDRGRDLVSTVNGCADRLKRALALLAASASDED